MERRSHNRKKQKPKKRWIKIITFSLLFILFIGIAWIGYRVNRTTEAIYNPIEESTTSNLRKNKVSVKDTKPISFLLLGVDHDGTRVEENTDVMILVTINPETKKAKMVSIPRDTPIPGTENKINSAYPDGGINNAVKQVQNLVGVPIDYYATVDMEGLSNVIEIIGDITVYNDFAFDFLPYYFPEGEITLTSGEEALTFVRMRYRDPEGDFGRNRRQQKLLLGILDKMSSPEVLTKVEPLFQVVEENVNTNLTVKEMTQLALNYRISSEDVETLSLVGETGTGVTGASLNYVSDEQIQEVRDALLENLELTLNDLKE